MTTSKFLSTVACVTLFAFLYVHQQTEIFRLAYIGQKKTDVFQELLDKNGILRYNLEKSVSLTRIGDKVSGRVGLAMPEGYKLVRLAIFQGQNSKAPLGLKKQNMFSRLFGIKTEAEARTVNPQKQ